MTHCRACPPVSHETAKLIPETDLFHQTLNRLNFPDHQFLDVMDFRHRSRRQVSGEAGREIEFSALGRHFHLILQENMDVIAPAFRVFTMDANGTKRRFTGFDVHEYYAGRVAGVKDSQVSAHVDSETGLLTASIAQDSDMYFVEPVRRAKTSASNSSMKMIVYKVNEAELALETEHRKLHDSISLNETVPFDPSLRNMAGEQNGNWAEESNAGRSKRQANEVTESRPTRCTLRLVADYRFYEEHGSDVKQTINYLVTVIDRINQIYLPTKWSDDDQSLTGFGFVVQEILVHEAPTPEADHYNSARDWTIRDILEAFSRDRNHKWYCLSHLFTHQRFESGVLGLAFVANLRKFVPGGICSQAVTKGPHTYYYNTGVTTTRNSFGKAIFTRITDLITAHEFGHNWGAEHDPDLAECSPVRGGGYIMHTFSLGGYDRNNKIFSPCSKRSITEVLRYKSLSCFISHRKSFCGNGIVDQGEECDSQLISGRDDDACCTSECRLKPTASCSDFNHFCCEDCQVKQEGSLCREANTIDCKERTLCDGKSAHCPPIAPPVPDASLCLDQGRCMAGTCIPFCESVGKQSCLCNEQNLQCNRCCRDASTNSSCVPHQPHQTLTDGTACIYGFCDNGVCQRKTQDMITRVWQFVDQGSVSRFVRIMTDNIVFAVIVLLLIVWVPASYYYQLQDDKKMEEKSDPAAAEMTSLGSPGSRRESSDQGDRCSGNSYKSKRTIYRPYDLTGVADFDTVDLRDRGSTPV